MTQSFRWRALLVISDGQALQHIGATRFKFEGVAVIAYRRPSVAALRVVVGESEVAGRRRRTLLEKRGKEILGSTLLRDAEIFAVARTIVEPNVPGKLRVSVHMIPKPPPHPAVPQRPEEGLVYLGGRLGKVNAD